MRFSRQLDETAGEIAESVGNSLFNLLMWLDAKRWHVMVFFGGILLLCTYVVTEHAVNLSRSQLNHAYKMAELDNLIKKYSQ